MDANDIPLGVVAAPANRHDSSLLAATLDTLDVIGLLPNAITVRLDRGYDFRMTLQTLAHRGLHTHISKRGTPAPLAAVGGGANAWTNAHKKLVWCTKRRAQVITFWIALLSVIIIVGRLIRQAWGPAITG